MFQRRRGDKIEGEEEEKEVNMEEEEEDVEEEEEGMEEEEEGVEEDVEEEEEDVEEEVEGKEDLDGRIRIVHLTIVILPIIIDYDDLAIIITCRGGGSVGECFSS